jgi:hypothetical protein
METMISLMQWLITGIGFTTVAVVVARSLSKEDSPLVSLLKPVQTVAIKVAGFAVVTYVILVTYYMSLGILSIQTIGSIPTHQHNTVDTSTAQNFKLTLQQRFTGKFHHALWFIVSVWT